MFQFFLYGFVPTFILLSLWGVVFGTMFLIWALAQHDLFFTQNEEGSAKIILRNRVFHRCIGALAGHAYRYETGGTRGHPWDVVETKGVSPATPKISSAWERAARDVKKKLRLVFGVTLLDGLEWVGIPPFYSVYAYSFKWSVLKIGGKGEKIPETKQESLRHIFLKQVVYLVTITGAETIEAAPMNASLVLTMRVVNPYKALFAVHNWLEAISDQVAATMRAIIGKHTFKELTEARETASKELEKDFAKRITAIKSEYGIEILIIQMQAIDPTEEVAKKIRDASLEGYTATQKATAIAILAKAEKDRITTVYGAIVAHGETGQAIRMAEAVERSNLSVIMSGGGLMPSFQIPTAPKGGGHASER